MKTVLLIDDEEEMVEMVAVSLLKAGYEVLSAFTGSDGIEKAKTGQPDVILLDVMMPDIDGFEICKELKAAQETNKIPVIFFTALGAPDLAERVAAAGGDDYVIKPFEPEGIIEKIERISK